MSANQDKFLELIKSEENKKQVEAWRDAPNQEAGVIPALADLMYAGKTSVAKAASESLKRLIHSTGKVKGNAKRAAVANQLLLLLEKKDKRIKTFALRHLSLIADEDSVLYIKKYMLDKELGEEGVFCIERIPGKASDDALIAALDKAPDDFKPRIIAALGHRKTEAAVKPLSAIISTSTKTGLILDAVKAVARIGAFPKEDEPNVDFDSLSDRDQGVLFDSVLRMADAKIAKGDKETAIEILGWIFNPPEEIPEHYVCAAIVCSKKIDDSNSVKTIAMKLSHANYVVRDTARKALKEMNKNTVIPVLKEQAGQATGKQKQAIEDILKAIG